MRKWLFRCVFLVVIFLAFLLRFYKIDKVPPSLNWDEVSISYNAYSILKTGKDEWGQFLPLHFKAYGEYKLPAQIYASIPGIAIFGLTELGVRITPVVYGTLTVLLLYLLATTIFKSRKIGLLSASLLAISPWHIHLTRASFESSFSVMWVTLGAWLAVKGLKEKGYLIASTVPFIIAIYTYNSARAFVPMFLIIYFLIYKENLLKGIKTLVICLIILGVAIIPIFTFWFKGEATSRLKLVSITDDPGFVQRINKARGASIFFEPLPRLIHNKITHFLYVAGNNYLAHFSPDFLFINGAPHKQHHVQNVGQLYFWQAPFVLVGLIYLFKKRKEHRLLIVSWLLLAFIPVSITIDSIPHALRTLLAVIPYSMVSGYGVFESYKLIERKGLYAKGLFILILLTALFFSMKNYLYNYYNIYPKLYSRDWQYGYKQVVSYIRDHYNEYDLIVFTRHFGEPHMFTLFFLSWDPAKYQDDPNLYRFETFDWVRVLKFDKFYFPDLGDEGTRFDDVRRQNPGKKMLFIGKQGDFPDYFNRVKSIDFLNGNRAFELVEVK